MRTIPEVVLSIFDNYESYAKRVMDYLMYEDGIVPLGCAIEEVERWNTNYQM